MKNYLALLFHNCQLSLLEGCVDNPYSDDTQSMLA